MRSVASVALFLIAAFTLPSRSVSQTPPDNDTRELTHLEQVWNQAHVAGDAETLDHLWADDLEVAVPHMAVMTRAEALGFARSGHMKFLSYETSDLRIRLYGDAAVVTGHLLRTRTLNGNKVADDWHFTKVYIRQAHQWRVVSFQASDSPTP
jgi:ketosteroid isomerase-like protein